IHHIPGVFPARQARWPDVTPPGHTEQATPVGAPMRTPAEPWTMLPPYCVMSP
ncbi:TPA: hypothetical protein PRO49_002674, partial [Escherichia coli]|nr:hypothetical protein [Escherichia coli]HDJ8028802.1 hypothetical protein [Escherichia coli]